MRQRGDEIGPEQSLESRLEEINIASTSALRTTGGAAFEGRPKRRG
jgi:hypothetical protein